MSVKGKIAIVTGAAGGIGSALAVRFASNGGRVLLVDIDEPGGRSVVESINQGHDQIMPAEFMRADVSKSADVQVVFEHIKSVFGKLDVLFNNAGISPVVHLAEMGDDEFDRVMAINFRSVFLMTREAIPVMRKSGGGVIVNMASINGMVAAPGLAAYSASKAAIINFTQATALEQAKDGIRAVAVCPASVDTPMLQAKFDVSPDPAAARASNLERHPIGGLATPEDVAALAVFLASDEAGFITGSAHLVDGGAAARRI